MQIICMMDGGIWIQTTLLTNNFSFYLKGPTKHFCFSASGVLNQRPAVGHCLSGVLSHLLVLSMTDQISSGYKIRLTISHVGICIYPFITATHFHWTMWLFPVQKNLWLMAWSKVNMQHLTSYNYVQTNDYRQFFKKYNLKENAMENLKFSYDCSQTFSNKSSLGIK